jgi:BirA family biotin operon repressor/biotin-[acetyl-CoA-carboxylase] ligase
MHLTCATAVAMCDAVEAACGFRPGIKWTNDLVAGKTKLGGILTELGLGPGGTREYAIIGIGINCCQDVSDFPEEIRYIAGSLHSVTGKSIDRVSVAAAMMDALYQMDQLLLTEKASLMDAYRRDCMTLGQSVSVVKADGSVRHGTALDIDEDGGLLIRFTDGSEEIVTSGEVSVRGMYGYI